MARQHHPAQVLIIDDDEDGSEAIGEMLRLEGYLPVHAPNSKRGLDYLRMGLRPCAILLDLLMPGDGWHFRAEQMANPDWADIPVVVGTGIGKLPETMAPELAIPLDHYLLKPFDWDALCGVLDRYCPRRTPSAAA